MSTTPPKGLVTRRLLSPRALIYFYRRRLRAHGTQETLAAVGIAGAVALVLAAGIAQGSIAGSSRQLVRAVIGPANLQLRARGPDGFPESLLARVEHMPGVKQAAPLLERSIDIVGPDGRSESVYVAGTDLSLAVLNGLGRTLPLNALTSGEIGLSTTSGQALGLPASSSGGHGSVTLLLDGEKRTLNVSLLLGGESIGALSHALVGVMSLPSMQALLGQRGRITRILVRTLPGAKAEVTRRLEALADGRLIVSGPEQDIGLLKQALKPSSQASDLFAVIGALLGFLLAFNAILLTVPERRQAIADLRLAGTRRSAIVQLVAFQALCLGVAASAVGLAGGYVLSRFAFHQSTRYLAEAFTISGGTVVSARTVLLAAGGGILVTFLASGLPLLDLRRSRPRDAIYVTGGVPGNAMAGPSQRWLLAAAIALLGIATALFLADPSSALIASATLALATVLAVPVTFAAVLTAARSLNERAPRLATLAIALGGVRGTTFRSLALAATGSVALFGSVALGGARSNLLSGIHGFASSYAADAPIWVGAPGDNQATEQLSDQTAPQIAHLGGVTNVQSFQGAFLVIGPRRVWVIARPPGGARSVLATQTLGGASAALTADRRLAEGGWIAVSQQLAAERHVRIGEKLRLPAPSGDVSLKVAALTSNLAWSPGVVFMGTRDFTRAWGSTAPSALAVHVASSAAIPRVESEITEALGPRSGLEVASAATRESSIDGLTGEGLSQLGAISTLLVLAAVMALAAALASSVHQRLPALAALRLAGAPPARLRRILLLEATLMLGAGCITGALAGLYGQFVIDAYLRHVTGFPVADAGASVRPLEIFVVVLGAALLIVALPAWLASRVEPGLALAEERE